MPEAPRRAKFAQVAQTARRQPSWLPASQKAAQAQRRESPSLKPPRLPSEFVEAVRNSGAAEAMTDAETGLAEFSGTRRKAGAK